jgi:hypothetical protein
MYLNFEWSGKACAGGENVYAPEKVVTGLCHAMSHPALDG